MSDHPGQWGSQGGFPPQNPQGPTPQGQHPQGPNPQGPNPSPGGNPQPGGYPQQGQSPGGYPQGGYPQGGYPQQGQYNPQGGYAPQGGYQPQGGGYQPPPGGPGQGQGGGGYGPPIGGGQQPKKKSNGMIIGIVVAALVLLVAIGGIVIALGRNNDQPVSTITPAPPSAPTSTDPTSLPTPSPSTSNPPSSNPPSTDPPSSQPPSSDPPNTPGGTISLGNGISLKTASGWKVNDKKANIAVLSHNGQEVFIGQVITVDKGTDPKDVVDGYHKQLAAKLTGVKNDTTKTVDLGSATLDAASGAMAGTLSTGQGSLYVITETIASVRKDGVTVLATIRYFKDSDPDMLKKDYGAMASSMLQTQALG